MLNIKNTSISLPVLIFAVFFSTHTFAKPTPHITELLAKESDLDEKCRGGSGDNPETMKACEERDKVYTQLKSKGWCYGKKGQLGYQEQWHKCTSQSNK